MRKSSFGGGRQSISGAPLRVLNDNVPTKSRLSSTSDDRFNVRAKSRLSSASDDRFSFGGRLSFASSKLPVLNQHQLKSSSSNQFSFLPKPGRPSSGIGIRGRTDFQKDPRPISDRRYQTQCIKQLLEFLMANNYTHPISQKLLVSPTSKDFFKIFEFIYGKFVKGYKLVPKMDEEVPRVLKMLGYPFVLSKTYLHSVGSPHSWQYLLAALIWMIDLLKMTASIADHGGIEAFIFEPEDDSFEGISEKKILFDYCEKTYTAFMSGDDTFEKFDEDLEHFFKQKYQGGNIEDIIAENARLEQEVGLLQQAEERQKQLQERIEISRHDGKVIQTYIVQIEQYKKGQEGEIQKLRDECEILVSDLQAEKEKLARMQEIYERQDLTPADVERLRAEQEGLKQQVDHLEKQIANIDADNWNVTMEQAKLNEKVEMEVATYNRQAIALKLVPETAELAEGVDFRLRTGFNADIVGICENHIKPKLMWMKKKCSADLHKKSKEKFQLTCEMEQFQEAMNEKKEVIAQMAKELVNKEAEIESLKQMLQYCKKVELIETLKQDVAQLETLLKQTVAERARILEEYKSNSSKLVSSKEAANRELCEMEENHKLVMKSITEHMDGLKENLSSVLSRLDKINSDMDKKTTQLEMESKHRNESQKSLLKKHGFQL